MSQATLRRLEEGNNPDGHHDHHQSTPNQPPPQGASNLGDSSGPLFSIYSKAAEEEDNKMVERWQKDADGILFFTGLFSAAVAALLAVTVQDLRPNSQDTSNFYLGNIYQVLADPNITHASISSPIAKPPFSPPRYAVWVNSLWFLSLVMSLSCALWATSLHQWARRYIRFTQPARCSPEKRARIREFFAEGVDKMHIPWAVEGLPTLLHISLFLFFGGLVIFLFNIDQEVFTCVISWIGLFSLTYGLITVLPLIRKDSPYYTPLSKPAWFLYDGIPPTTIKVLFLTSNAVLVFILKGFALITSSSYESSWGYPVLTFVPNNWIGSIMACVRPWASILSGGMDKKAGEMALERKSEIDARILGWTTSALGDDGSLERLFEAIPGFFNSKLVNDLRRYLPYDISFRLWDPLVGFIGRTLSSNSVTESVKSRRVIICGDIICRDIIPCPERDAFILYCHLYQAPVSIETVRAMAQWFIPYGFSDSARTGAAAKLARVQDRDGHWIALASDLYGLSEHDLQHNIALGGDNVLLAILIHLSRRGVAHHELEILEAISQFDIRQTLPGLQNDFCTLWNELARSQGDYGISVRIILARIRHLYTVLHQGTDAPPTAPSVSTEDLDPVLYQPSSYPLCDIASHRPDTATATHAARGSAEASPHQPALGCTTALQSTEETRTITGLLSPPDPSIASKIGDTSRAPTATFPARSSSDMSPQDGVATAQPDITSVAKSSQPLESDEQQGQATPYVTPPEDISGTVPKAVPVSASTPPVLHESFATHDTSPPSISESSLPASFGGISAPGTHPPPHIPSLSNA